MGILKKVGKAVGGAIVKTGKWTAASIKRKNLQNKVKRMILERFRKEDLKRMFKEYGVSEPPLPERGYYKKSDYVNWAYSHFKLKTVIQWAQKHRIKIKDIMDYYIAEMEKIDREYGSSKESVEEDKKIGVEDIEMDSSEFEAPSPGESSPTLTSSNTKRGFESSDGFFEELLSAIKYEFGDMIKDIKIVSESEFQKQLYIFLKSRFREHEIRQRVDWRVDLLIDGKYALELKYADNSGTMDKGIREIKDYKKHTPYIAMIVFYPGTRMNRETLTKYIRYYEEEGARVLVLEGRGERKRSSHDTHIIVRR